MNQKRLLSEFLKSFIFLIVVLAIGYFTRENLQEILLIDESSVGGFWAVFGTIYALVTAFVLVLVWEQFVSVDNSIAKEAATITSLWNYTDFLDDKKVSKKMQKSLLKYIETIVDKEAGILAKGGVVSHPSVELIEIMEVLDGVTFDDPRDEVAFSHLINAFEALSEARESRIAQSTTRIPPLIRTFYLTVSFVFVFSYVIHTYHNAVLYYLTLSMLTMVVSLSSLIIFDTDNPFEGIWNLSWDVLANAREYIKAKEHN